MTQAFVLNANDAGRETVLANLVAFVQRLPSDKPWRVEIDRQVKKRTDPQNRALWSVAYPALQKATGHGVNDWHEYMLGEWFGWTEYTLFGKRKLRPARTTTTGFDGEDSKLSTEDFALYFDFIKRRAAENGVHIDDPDPLWRENRKAA